MVILRSRNKITDFFMILAWASPFKYREMSALGVKTVVAQYLEPTGKATMFFSLF